MEKNQFKPVINFETLPDFEQAWQEGQVLSNNLVRILSTDTYYRLDPSDRAPVEISNPADPANDTIFIWWQDKIHCRWNSLMREKAQSAEVQVPVLPGAITMAMDHIDEHTEFDGRFIVPLPLRHSFDPDVIHDVVDNQAVKDILMKQFIGIPFEICHYDKIKHYAGIITTLDLRLPDLTAMRELLNV